VLAAAAYLRDVASLPAVFAAIFLVAGHTATTTLVRTLVLISLVRHLCIPSFLVNKKSVRGTNTLS
jgi:hypothetical protein